MPPDGWYSAVGGGGPPGPPVGGPATTADGGGPPGTGCGTTPTAGAYPAVGYWAGLTPGAAPLGGGPSAGTKFIGGGGAPPPGTTPVGGCGPGCGTLAGTGGGHGTRQVRGGLGRLRRRSLRCVRGRCILGLRGWWRLGRLLLGRWWRLLLLLRLTDGSGRGDVLTRSGSTSTTRGGRVVEGRRLVVLDRCALATRSALRRRRRLLVRLADGHVALFHLLRRLGRLLLLMRMLRHLAMNAVVLLLHPGRWH
uniref:Uncharacterized protein n=1 Tax=Anopheles merus TaxID=30066 RepID=A0A182V6L7_ANOME